MRQEAETRCGLILAVMWMQLVLLHTGILVLDISDNDSEFAVWPRYIIS